MPQVPRPTATDDAQRGLRRVWRVWLPGMGLAAAGLWHWSPPDGSGRRLAGALLLLGAVLAAAVWRAGRVQAQLAHAQRNADQGTLSDVVAEWSVSERAWQDYLLTLRQTRWQPNRHALLPMLGLLVALGAGLWQLRTQVRALAVLATAAVLLAAAVAWASARWHDRRLHSLRAAPPRVVVSRSALLVGDEAIALAGGPGWQPGRAWLRRFDWSPERPAVFAVQLHWPWSRMPTHDLLLPAPPSATEAMLIAAAVRPLVQR